MQAHRNAAEGSDPHNECQWLVDAKLLKRLITGDPFRRSWLKPSVNERQISARRSLDSCN
jgi:hypothetical protein